MPGRYFELLIFRTTRSEIRTRILDLVLSINSINGNEIPFIQKELFTKSKASFLKKS